MQSVLQARALLPLKQAVGHQAARKTKVRPLSSVTLILGGPMPLLGKDVFLICVLDGDAVV